ncbi:MAG TPA: response regulator [Verrucomicrobiae bacterium]
MARVMIVDDSPELRSSLSIQLQRVGHTVSTAKHGRDALDRLKIDPVDLILLDYHMPFWDGVESMVLFNQNGIKSPVIAYTCKAAQESSPFETVMASLGAAAAVRCSRNVDELLRTTERLANPAQAPAPAYPESILWDNVRMLTFGERDVTILFRNEATPQKYYFADREEMERVLASWFAQRGGSSSKGRRDTSS